VTRDDLIKTKKKKLVPLIGFYSQVVRKKKIVFKKKTDG